MYRYTQNLHTHTRFCDGKNIPEELVEKAIILNFDTIGFSGHSTTDFDVKWQMNKEETELYRQEVNSLKTKYADKIVVLCGLEFDVFSNCQLDGYDYVIGSSHFLKIDNEYVEFDADAATVSGIIEHYFSGNGLSYAKAYYSQMAELWKYGKFDIVGHFDIIAKHCETHDFFDVTSSDYRNSALEALYALTEKIRVFEVNTGAIARGYRTAPYPAPFILKEMKELGCTVILTADCHDADFLDCHYKESIDYIKACGFDSIGVMKCGQISEVRI